ncbi:hypothetical protein JL720_10509 [Aureococcus anophagefferens]|nr:hypothetical protein JL720_10509 [Aureococcus anophagefferens]
MADDDESMANGFVVLAPKKRPAEAPPQRPPRRSFRLDDDDESMANGFVVPARPPPRRARAADARRRRRRVRQRPLARSGARVGVPDGVVLSELCDVGGVPCAVTVVQREWRAVVHAVDLERGDEYSASSELHARYVDAAAPTDDQKLALYRELVGECAFRSTLASKHQAKATRQLVKEENRRTVLRVTPSAVLVAQIAEACRHHRAAVRASRGVAAAKRERRERRRAEAAAKAAAARAAAATTIAALARRRKAGKYVAWVLASRRDANRAKKVAAIAMAKMRERDRERAAALKLRKQAAHATLAHWPRPGTARTGSAPRSSAGAAERRRRSRPGPAAARARAVRTRAGAAGAARRAVAVRAAVAVRSSAARPSCGPRRTPRSRPRTRTGAPRRSSTRRNLEKAEQERVMAAVRADRCAANAMAHARRAAGDARAAADGARTPCGPRRAARRSPNDAGRWRRARGARRPAARQRRSLPRPRARRRGGAARGRRRAAARARSSSRRAGGDDGPDRAAPRRAAARRARLYGARRGDGSPGRRPPGRRDARRGLRAAARRAASARAAVRALQGLARRALDRAEASRRRVAKAEADAARAKAARLAAYAEARAEKEARRREEARRAAELRRRADAAASIQRVARGRQLRVWLAYEAEQRAWADAEAARANDDAWRDWAAATLQGWYRALVERQGAANEAAWREWAASVVQAWYRERLAIHNVELSNAMFMRRRAAEAAEAEAQKVADEAARVADVEAKAAAAREHLEKQRESARDAEDDFYGGDDGEPDEDIDDFDVDDEDDVAMLFTFVRHGRRDKLKKFCARGFDVDLRNAHGHTLAMVAAQNNQKAILKVLCKFGVNINEQDYKGNTALHYANMYGYTRLAEYMVEKLEADETVVNRQGSSCWLTVDDQ